VDAPTDARKERAVEILREHRAHTVNYLGRLAWGGGGPPPPRGGPPGGPATVSRPRRGRA
jgi:hypothetical protein